MGVSWLSLALWGAIPCLHHFQGIDATGKDLFQAASAASAKAAYTWTFLNLAQFLGFPRIQHLILPFTELDAVCYMAFLSSNGFFFHILLFLLVCLQTPFGLELRDGLWSLSLT